MFDTDGWGVAGNAKQGLREGAGVSAALTGFSANSKYMEQLRGPFMYAEAGGATPYGGATGGLAFADNGIAVGQAGALWGADAGWNVGQSNTGVSRFHGMCGSACLAPGYVHPAEIWPT